MEKTDSLKHNQQDKYVLQETHNENIADEQSWTRKWGQAVWNPGSHQDSILLDPICVSMTVR